MVFEDFVRLHFAIGVRNIPVAALGLEWPPPKYIHLLGDDEMERRGLDHSFEGLNEVGFRKLSVKEQSSCLKRESHSRITDEQIVNMEHVIRGADYRYVVTS